LAEALYALKKSLRAAEQDRPDVTAGRKALQKQQPDTGSCHPLTGIRELTKPAAW
jgi:hypothetical protein